MSDFKSKYPIFASLLLIVGAFASKAAAQGETLVQKAEDELTLAPEILAFYPQASQLGVEYASLKSSPSDIEAGVEVLVTDLQFSSAKAQQIIPASFAVAEWIVGGISPIKALEAAIKG